MTLNVILLLGQYTSAGSELIGSKKIMVVYFSHSGNTRALANQIQKSAGGDIFEIEAVAKRQP